MKIQRRYVFNVPEGEACTRLSDYLHRAFPDVLTRKGGKKAISRGQVFVNGEQGDSAHWVATGDVIVYRPDAVPSQKVFPHDLEVVYEDDCLAVVVKPAGLLVSGNQYRTVQQALPHNLLSSSQPDALPWPLPVHRLDYLTSGLLLVAKTQQARVALGGAFEKRQVEKTYHAVCEGAVPTSGTIEREVEGKTARTTFERIDHSRSLHCGWVSLVKLQPHTGRKHQLRQHMHAIGHPIVGDPLYHAGTYLRHKGLFLAATGLRLRHPIQASPLAFDWPIPGRFARYVEREYRMWAKVQGR